MHVIRNNSWNVYIEFRANGPRGSRCTSINQSSPTILLVILLTRSIKIILYTFPPDTHKTNNSVVLALIFPPSPPPFLCVIELSLHFSSLQALNCLFTALLITFKLNPQVLNRLISHWLFFFITLKKLHILPTLSLSQISSTSHSNFCILYNLPIQLSSDYLRLQNATALSDILPPMLLAVFASYISIIIFTLTRANQSYSCVTCYLLGPSTCTC